MSISKKIHLRDGEDIVAIIRSYALTSLWLYVIGVGFLVYTAFFTFWLFTKGWWGGMLFGLGLAAGLYIIFHTWFFSYYNFLIITSDRIVDISRHSWFDETISSVSYTDLKDVAVRRRGMLASIFNFGSVVITAAAEKYILEIERIYQPEKIQELILQKKDSFRDGRHVRNNEAIFNGFLKIVSELSEAELTLADKKIRDQLALLDENIGVKG